MFYSNYLQFCYSHVVCNASVVRYFTWKLCLWHAEVAHDPRKVKRVLGNSVTHGVLYAHFAVCTAVQILDMICGT
jgi:hypothetical protein